MKRELYTIGVDFGTLSGRAVLVNAQTREIAAVREKNYPHGVMTELCGQSLPAGWALQDPSDYLTVLDETIPSLLRESSVLPEAVVGIGFDATSCTMLPTTEDGMPLCCQEKYRAHPHAYGKLWKHHAAQPQANLLESLAEKEAPLLLARYGGKVSAQWMLPKILQILEEAPEIYHSAGLFLETVDWLTLQLTGQLTRNSCSAGFKALWNPKEGYPPPSFLKKLDGRMEHLISEKLHGGIASPWEQAGTLRPQWAERLGLSSKTSVAAGIIDAHAGVLGSGSTSSGMLFLVIGTSSCHILLSPEEKYVPGICGSCRDSILPGLYAYEAGQSCVGDMLEWFIQNNVPTRYTEQAKAQKISTHQLLSQQAAKLHPGESGLLALDWWNGQRTPLVDSRLSGAMLGMTLRTTPAEQYRALLEATAYGTRWILEVFEQAGIKIREITACGGIARKNPFAMQLYADILQRPIRATASEQASALGAAILAAVSAGVYQTPEDAVNHMACREGTVYRPDPGTQTAYQSLYQKYRMLAAFCQEQLRISS